jgi:hypothetical protein
MSKLVQHISRATLGLAVVLSFASVTLAAGPVKGGVYKGTTLHNGLLIIVKVSKSGKSVTVRLPDPPSYCGVGIGLRHQTTKAATISKRGSFQATIADEFSTEPTAPVTQFVSGKFSGRTVRGTVHTAAGTCSGSSSFSAKAPASRVTPKGNRLHSRRLHRGAGQHNDNCVKHCPKLKTK